MISLINGHIQDVSGNPIVPYGSIELYLNGDAQLLASPYGQVLGGTTNSVTFYFDENCDLITPAQIWSNAELNPQNSEGLGTWYIVNFYDENGARLNNAPMIWVFPNSAGSTVDISNMVNVAAGRIYYPDPFVLYPVPANYVLIGPPSGAPAIPTFRLASFGAPATTLSTTAPNAGNFTIAHGLTGAPSSVEILMSSPGAMWVQTPTSWDSTNIYLTASDAGLTALVYVFQ
jgi:hypothetical protein